MSLKKYIDELKRRHVIKSGLAYLIVAWVITEVASVILPTFNAPPYIFKTLLFILGIGFPVLLIFSWAYDFTPEGIKKNTKSGHYDEHRLRTRNRLNRVIIGALSLAVVMLVFNQFYDKNNDTNEIVGTIESHEKSIAVLPFTNMSNDSEQDYFCNGIAEDILNNLTQLEDIRVVARATSFIFNKKNQDIMEIGKKLGVQTIVEGSVQKEGNKLRIRAELVNVLDGSSIWSERYYRDLEDVFTIQNEIAQNIVKALKLKLSENEELEIEKINTQDIKAYDFYIRGRYYFYQGQQYTVRLGIPMFEKAIEIDENYALAYCGLADSYSIINMFFERTEENLEKALAASQKAVSLDPDLAEAHSSKGFALQQHNEFEEAEKEFLQAIKLNPKLYIANYQYARACRARGQHAKSIDLFKRSSEIEPDNYNPIIFLVGAYESLNMMDESKKANLKSIEVLRKHLDLNPDDVRAYYLGAGSLVRADEKDEAMAWINKALIMKPNDISVLYNAACIYSLLGKLETALDLFEKAIDAGFASKEWIENDSDLDNIKIFPRFKKIVEKLK